MSLDLGQPADIGLQVASKPYKAGGVGGQFEVMIKQGTPAPCVAQKTFTTVVDMQTKAAIVVVAKRSNVRDRTPSTPGPGLATKNTPPPRDHRPAFGWSRAAQALDGVILGHFSMDGITPGKTGGPKVEVSLKLADEKTLHASAVYKQGNKQKTLTFQAAKRQPGLRAVTNSDEVPEEY